MLTRRKLITIAVQAALAGTCLPLLPACTEPVGDTGAVLIERSELVDLLLTFSGVSYAGPVCALKLGLGPQTNPLNLQQSLHATLLEKLSSGKQDTDIGQRLQQLSRQDFVADRVLDIEGWQLSETECQANALAASLQGFTEALQAEKTAPIKADFVEVENWGPRSTIEGETFNEQPDGHSGIWIKASGVPPATVLMFSNVSQSTNIYADHLTSGLRGTFMKTIIAKPGKYSVDLYDQDRHRIQHLGEFEVVARKEPLPFEQCRVAAWGPQQAVSGQPFNEQASGASAFWIRTNCTLDDGVVVFEGRKLKTTIRPQDGLITASMPDGHTLAPGSYPLKLLFADSGVEVAVRGQRECTACWCVGGGVRVLILPLFIKRALPNFPLCKEGLREI
jgi:hypothetical protein